MSPPLEPEGKSKVLVVDDHGLMRLALCMHLQPRFPGCEFLEAWDGASARAAVREHQPRLVLMDVGLPDANGLELTAEMRKAFPEMQVIVVTQHEGAHYREHARAAGAFAYVVKDRVGAELAGLVAAALDIAAARGTDSAAPVKQRSAS